MAKNHVSFCAHKQNRKTKSFESAYKDKKINLTYIDDLHIMTIVYIDDLHIKEGRC